MDMKGVKFIRPKLAFDKAFKGAVLYEKEFLCENSRAAKLCLAAMGFCVVYINGIRINQDSLSPSFSNYNKTVWYVVYDVEKHIKTGKNRIVILCGNGYFNEGISSVWHLDQEPTRDFPKIAFRLYADDKLLLQTDESFIYTLDTPLVYTQLRMGEYIDLRKLNETRNYGQVEYASSPLGVFRYSDFPAIKETERLKAQKIVRRKDGAFVVDFGRNIAGYIHLCGILAFGKEVKITYAENVTEEFDLTSEYTAMSAHFTDCEFQVDKIIGNGKAFEWKPLFTYHGFRYVIINGLEELQEKSITAIVIHNDVKRTIEFSCSNEKLNKLYKMAINAIYSNMHNMLTDCPTREKFGWQNDAMCTAETLFYNFEAKAFAKKCLRDAIDSVKNGKEITSILPACKWGYENCHGIFMGLYMFELADCLYEVYGDSSGYEDVYPIVETYLGQLISELKGNGLLEQAYGLRDWAGPYTDESIPMYKRMPTPLEFSDSVLLYKGLKLAAKMSACFEKTDRQTFYKTQAERLKKNIIKQYLDENGRCIIHEQPMVALLVAFGLYERLDPLKAQLKQTVEEKNFHHYCGMISLRYLYDSLKICGLEEYAYKIITAEGFPSYNKWLEQGETSLCESWFNRSSKNHHMFSSFVNFLVKTMCGFHIHCGNISIEMPYIPEEINFVNFSYTDESGKIEIRITKDEHGRKYLLKNESKKMVVFVEKDISFGKEVYCWLPG